MSLIQCSYVDDGDCDDDGGGVPDEAVLPEDVEELPREGAGHRPHLLLHDVCHPRHPQLDKLTLNQLSCPGTARHDRLRCFIHK